MPIEPSPAPPAATEAVQRSLAGGAAKSKFSPSYFSLAEVDALSLSVPHRVAYLPLDKIHRGADLREVTELGSWRFLVHERRRSTILNNDVVTGSEEFAPIAAATAAMSGAAKYELGELNEGPFVKGTEEAIRRAETFEEVRKGRYKAFLLTVPAVHVVALWLQDCAGHADILLTIPPSHSALQPYRPMTPAAFLDILHALRERVPPIDATAG